MTSVWKVCHDSAALKTTSTPWLFLIGGMCLWPGLAGGCGDIFARSQAPLFVVALSIDGEAVGPAVIDTGGGYEVMLREDFGLEVVDTAEVLAFGGTESVRVTEGFRYNVGEWETVADAAIVGLSVCDCNGLGFLFFRKTGAVLGLDFSNLRTEFLATAPGGGVSILFEPPPSFLPGFDAAFVNVEVASGGDSRMVLGLLDTGTNATVMRRGLVGTPSLLTPNRLDVTVTQDKLGTVAAQVGLFDTEGLPDIILGTDVMRVWADRWYFAFTPEGGTVTVFPRGDGQSEG